MAMSVVYGNAFGGIISENRGGTVSCYVPDTLGSTIGLMNSAGNLTDTWTYWPYGEIRTRTGNNVTPLCYFGAMSYYTDSASGLIYATRFLDPKCASWQTVSSGWPDEDAYTFMLCDPLVNPYGALLVTPSPSGAICPSGYVQAGQCSKGSKIDAKIGKCIVDTVKTTIRGCGLYCSALSGQSLAGTTPGDCPTKCKVPNVIGLCITNTEKFSNTQTMTPTDGCFCSCPETGTTTTTLCICCTKPVKKKPPITVA